MQNCVREAEPWPWRHGATLVRQSWTPLASRAVVDACSTHASETALRRVADGARGIFFNSAPLGARQAPALWCEEGSSSTEFFARPAHWHGKNTTNVHPPCLFICVSFLGSSWGAPP